MTHRGSEQAALALERVLFFSDAVMAIAITLLAIDLRLPEARDEGNRELLRQIREIAPDFLAFLISFAVIGVYWVAHHRMFRYIDGFDPGLLFHNLAFLFFVALQPFLTALLGRHGHLPAAVAIYAGGVAVMGLSSSRLWAHAVARKLVTPDVTPGLAQLAWLLLLPAQRLLGRRLHEHV